jgi:hypothetical protein
MDVRTLILVILQSVAHDVRQLVMHARMLKMGIQGRGPSNKFPAQAFIIMAIHDKAQLSIHEFDLKVR